MGFFTKLFGPGGKSGPRTDLKNRFDLINRSGQGSMSKVWRARDRKLGREVCLKILDKEKTLKFEDRFKGLKKPSEGEISVQLRHRNIVQTFEHGLSKEGDPFLVMEWVEGSGLEAMVGDLRISRKNPKLATQRLQWLIQLAGALEYMHGQKFIHRDICPRNVMIDKDGDVRLIDFGLAVPYTEAFCKPGNRTGTPSHLAPEIIKRVHTDHRVDLFALGVTAYEMFTGDVPWDKTDTMQMLRNHVNNTGRDPRELMPDLEDNVVKFLVKAIERDPRERFQTAVEFRDAVKALRAE